MHALASRVLLLCTLLAAIGLLAAPGPRRADVRPVRTAHARMARLAAQRAEGEGAVADLEHRAPGSEVEAAASSVTATHRHQAPPPAVAIPAEPVSLAGIAAGPRLGHAHDTLFTAATAAPSSPRGPPTAA